MFMAVPFLSHSSSRGLNTTPTLAIVPLWVKRPRSFLGLDRVRLVPVKLLRVSAINTRIMLKASAVLAQISPGWAANTASLAEILCLRALNTAKYLGIEWPRVLSTDSLVGIQ